MAVYAVYDVAPVGGVTHSFCPILISYQQYWCVVGVVGYSVNKSVNGTVGGLRIDNVSVIFATVGNCVPQ